MWPGLGSRSHVWQWQGGLLRTEPFVANLLGLSIAVLIFSEPSRAGRATPTSSWTTSKGISHSVVGCMGIAQPMLGEVWKRAGEKGCRRLEWFGDNVDASRGTTTCSSGIDLEGVPLLGARLLRELHWCGSLEVETALHLKEVGRVLDEKPRYLWNVLGALGRMFNASGT